MQLRPDDKRLATQSVTAYLYNVEEALVSVFRETNADPGGPQGLVLGLLDYCAWLSATTGPLLDHPSDLDPRDEP